MKKIFFLLLSFAAFSEVKLPSLVSNGMVLQRDMPVKIWGWANPGEKVNVIFKGKKIRAIGDSKGNWACTLPATPAGGPYEITINEKSVKDVLFGDVWLCAGQSNMVINMERVKEKYPADIASANNPKIRNFFIPTAISKVDARTDLPASSWLPVTPENVLQMGAVSYFFARDLYAQYQVPIGIINSSVGGTPIESWISEAGLKEFPAYVKDTSRLSPPSERLTPRRNRPNHFNQATPHPDIPVVQIAGRVAVPRHQAQPLTQLAQGLLQRG